MLIKKITFIDEIKNVYNVDVGVEFEDGYSYTIVVSTPGDLLEKMDQEKMTFIRPGSLMIIVKKLTKEIVTEAIEAYAEDDGYWLKFHQFSADIMQVIETLINMLKAVMMVIPGKKNGIIEIN